MQHLCRHVHCTYVAHYNIVLSGVLIGEPGPATLRMTHSPQVLLNAHTPAIRR